MSYSTNSRAIEPFRLLSESFSQVGPVYLPLLLLAVPVTVLSIAEVLTRKPQSIQGQVVLGSTTTSSVLLTLSLIVSCLLFGSIFLLVYRYIKQGTLDVSGSIQEGIAPSARILFGFIIYSLAVAIGILLLIIPGIYLSVALGFFAYAMLSEKCSLVDSFKYSLALVKGRWWQVFGAFLVLLLPILPIVIASSLLGAIVGTAMGSAGSKLISIEIASSIISSVLIIFIMPIINMYYVKLYSRLQETMNQTSLNN